MTDDANNLDPALLKVIYALARADAACDFDAASRDQEREPAKRRVRASFTNAEIRRAVLAVEAAGKSVGAVDFPPSGGFRLIIGAPSSATERNEWDDVLEDTPEQALARFVRNQERKKQGQTDTLEAWRDRKKQARQAASGRGKKGPF